MRVTVCISADKPEEGASFADWQQKWKDMIVFISEDYGCGCCVNLFDIEASEEAIADILPEIFTESDWAKEGLRTCIL